MTEERKKEKQGKEDKGRKRYTGKGLKIIPLIHIL